jgi:PilZ domain-containing protein
VIRPARAASLAPQGMDQMPGTEPFRITRREQRSSAQLTFAACGLAASGRFFVELCSTINISRSGCCLRLRTRPQTDSALALRAVPGGTSLPEGTSQLLFQLAWVRPDEGGWLIGAFALSNVDLSRLAFPSYTP